MTTSRLSDGGHRSRRKIGEAAVVLAVALVAFLIGRWSRPQVSIVDDGITVNQANAVIIEKPEFSLLVENGCAYDLATVDLSSASTLCVPDNATVYSGGAAGTAVIHIEKELGFAGHPPEPMSIRTARKYMGVATKTEGETLWIATFGEWDSHKEGGASVRLVLHVPDDVHVEKQPGLSGEYSKGQIPDQAEGAGPKVEIPVDCYWYGPVGPAPGWTALTTVADPSFRAALWGCPTGWDSATSQENVGQNQNWGSSVSPEYSVEIPHDLPEEEVREHPEQLKDKRRVIYPRRMYAERHRRGWLDCSSDFVRGKMVSEQEEHTIFQGYRFEWEAYLAGYESGRSAIENLIEDRGEAGVRRYVRTLLEAEE